ncbi:DUF1450 domain-containing protein [Halostella sp. JP-L12]|uniref:DUF1450 domain-containing protein n=1 Tax=Halostella TaxID=1843185 RepID=UPI0013CE6C88|nr:MULTISPECIES: DUF1450 domain-containing protein [Halostella]NHN48228.1 DUF1450 domain-containing protein [Halostella sp. JP-L12]
MIEYCLSNVDAETRRRLAAREDSREAACLEQCGRCHREAFLVVDGTVRSGPSHAAVLDDLDE